ncbi:MAG: SPOR domain-containing protein [Gemmatimonadetes bacterium]|nr:SPOR domain-containing protein [Gemmatimonadota bacterium]MDA1103146.1 SPOR domain-containing protein [Gemmatimonadota bacterium]
MNGVARLLALVALAAATFTMPAGAQSGLERVEELTRLGRADEARAALVDWWEGDREDASRRDLQRGLWLRGRLTVDPVQAELDFQRLVVLYPSGQFTPQAILRLAQASFAMGDEAAAQRYVATLVRDYPSSDARKEADAWLSRAGPVPPAGDTPTRVAESPRATDSTRAAAPAPTSQRPTPTAAPVREAPVREPPVRSDSPAAAVEVGPAVMNYYVQLGAFADDARAVALAEEVRATGVDVRVVRVEGSQFTHVRFGRFAAREDAVEQLEALTARGISAALVRDDRVETPVRD